VFVCALCVCLFVCVCVGVFVVGVKLVIIERLLLLAERYVITIEVSLSSL